VEFCNALFCAAFGRDSMSSAAVELRPRRDETIDTPAVARWQIEATGAERWQRLARAVAATVADGINVVDPQTNAARAVRFADVAVLAATNDHVEAIARELRRAGVPMKMSLAGLLAVPEVLLARACLRRLDDATDTLASAEIIALAGDRSPETWLTDRLQRLAAGEPSYAWGESDHPVLAAIARLRFEMTTRSPLEIVARVLNYVGIRAIVTAWGPDAVTANQRQRNLDAFLDLAVQYEQHCSAQYEPATLTGFLFWIEHPSSPELDLQPVVTGGDAVHVLTYHKAKGLEWPMVIAADLDYTWRSRLWDVRVTARNESFDIAAPLRERDIRYWPNPFGRHSANVPVLTAIEASAEARACLRAKQAEDRRLAYVGLTRARDVLVLLQDGKTSAQSWRAAFDDSALCPTVYTVDPPEQTRERRFAPSWFTVCAPSRGLLPATVSPSSLAPTGDAHLGQVLELGGRIPIRTVAMDALGNALHRIIAAHCLNPAAVDARTRAAEVLAGYGVEAALSADDAIAAADRLHAQVFKSWQPTGLRVEYPVSRVLDNGQTVRGFVDLLVDTAAGVHLIDHKSSPRPRSEWADEISEYSGQLRAYRDALTAAGEQIAGVWIHFAISGALVEVRFTAD
jgi:ATP-dependent exoDNAse (exonuclease V) beta subunit